MEAEHANVPPRYPRDHRTDAGNFGKFRYGYVQRGVSGPVKNYREGPKFDIMKRHHKVMS
jgi:hypothetical protein